MNGQYESKDVDVRAVVQFGLGLAALIAVAMIAMWLLFRYLAQQPATSEASPFQQRVEPLPRPALQVNPSVDLDRRRASDDAILNSYRWVDKEKGVVGIPIGRAMDLVAAKESGGRGSQAAGVSK